MSESSSVTVLTFLVTISKLLLSFRASDHFIPIKILSIRDSYNDVTKLEKELYDNLSET